MKLPAFARTRPLLFSRIGLSNLLNKIQFTFEVIPCLLLGLFRRFFRRCASILAQCYEGVGGREEGRGGEGGEGRVGRGGEGGEGRGGWGGEGRGGEGRGGEGGEGRGGWGGGWGGRRRHEVTSCPQMVETSFRSRVEFQANNAQLVRSTGANVSVMLLQDPKSSPQKSRPFGSGHRRPGVWLAIGYSYISWAKKMNLNFSANMAGFCRDSHIWQLI